MFGQENKKSIFHNFSVGFLRIFSRKMDFSFDSNGYHFSKIQSYLISYLTYLAMLSNSLEPVWEGVARSRCPSFNEESSLTMLLTFKIRKLNISGTFFTKKWITKIVYKYMILILPFFFFEKLLKCHFSNPSFLKFFWTNGSLALWKFLNDIFRKWLRLQPSGYILVEKTKFFPKVAFIFKHKQACLSF